MVGMQLPVSGPTREEHEALVAAVRRLAAALMWSRGTAVEPVMTTQDNFGERSGAVPVPQTKENVVGKDSGCASRPRTSRGALRSTWRPSTPRFRRRRISTGTTRRPNMSRFCRRNYIDKDATMLLATKNVELLQTPVHRQGCRRTYGDTATGYSFVAVTLLSLNQATKHVEIPQKQYIYKVAMMVVVVQRQVPQSQTVAKVGRSPAGAVRRHFCGRPL